MRPQATTPSARRAQYAAECRARNRAFVDAINARTACAHCGAQPVEWHNPEHALLNRPDRRISNMVYQPASIKKIEAELATCTPLCRRCHMLEDGRAKALVEKAPRPKVVDPQPCAQCALVFKPLRRGLCARCDGERRRRAQGCLPAGPRPTCRKGHPLTDDNVLMESNGYRRCLTCRRAYQRAGRPV